MPTTYVLNIYFLTNTEDSLIEYCTNCGLKTTIYLTEKFENLHKLQKEHLYLQNHSKQAYYSILQVI